MIKAMLERSRTFHGRDVSDGTFELDFVNAMLDAVEEAGMIPPSREFEFGGKMMKDNGWEPEDAD